MENAGLPQSGQEIWIELFTQEAFVSALPRGEFSVVGGNVY